MSKLLVVFSAIIGMTSAPACAQNASLAQQYLDRLVAVWDVDAVDSDVHSLLTLFDESATYEHPRVGARMEGVDAIRRGMTAFLGTSRAPRLSNIEIVAGTGVRVLGFDLSLEVWQEDVWQPLNRRQVIVLEVAQDRITTVRDYW